MSETPGSANVPQDVQGDGPVSLEDRTEPGGQGSPGSNQAKTEPAPTGPAKNDSRSIDDLNVGSADPQAPRHPATLGSGLVDSGAVPGAQPTGLGGAGSALEAQRPAADPTTSTGRGTGPEMPVQDTGGTAHRAPGLQGQTPPGEAIETDVEGGAARMGPAAVDTTAVSEGQGDASTVPASGSEASPGTSEEHGVVHGVRLADAAEVPKGD